MAIYSSLRLMARLLCVAVILGCALPPAWSYPAVTTLHRRARRDTAPQKPVERAAPRGSASQLEESLHQLLQQASLKPAAPQAPGKIGPFRAKPVQSTSNIPSPSFQNIDLSYLLGPGGKQAMPVAPPKYMPVPQTNAASAADVQEYLNLLSKYQLGGNAAATAPNLLAANYPSTAGQADLLPNAYPQNSYTADDYIEELEDAVSYIMNKLYQYQAMKQLNNEYADYYQLLREVPAPQDRGFDYSDYLDLLDPALYGDDTAYEHDSAAYRENEPANDEADPAESEPEAADSEDGNAVGSGDESSASETEKADNATKKPCADGSDGKNCIKKDSDKADLVSRLQKFRS